MHFQGPAFIRYAADVAHQASVPISIHLDHCLKPEDADLALECAFDSIMVDGSLFEEQENIRYVKSVVDRAKAKGITVEAELGRMEGGEDGLPTIDLESVWTDPDVAADFVRQTGVHFLAPSFGNVHGPYPSGGAEKHWQIESHSESNADRKFDPILDLPYINCFFEHANVTYRYVPRTDIIELFDLVYADGDTMPEDPTKMAMLLLVMGLGAWLTLGYAVRLGQMVDIQREQASCDRIEAHYRRCVFWAMFMIDRYISVSLGRPMAINERDSNIILSAELDSDVASQIGQHEKKLLVGVVAHTRNGKVSAGHTFTDIVAELEAEIQDWLRDTPDFFIQHREPSIEAAVEEAMKVHRRLDYNVNINAQRLLEVV
ncbi:unnamed protein product [Parascedosporium putredinis]|uniref:Fructose-bisphosphate aldolase n=1 Tax=Parascedosporium putredinis TaxID=1442378 RepID=A0A9P1M6H8_9PEZI|nr:unnamed protein product [Parascedosporium putredinis]CAI7989715.1 unnamed protein product [Parascedosporium putredinis]